MIRARSVLLPVRTGGWETRRFRLLGSLAHVRARNPSGCERCVDDGLPSREDVRPRVRTSEIPLVHLVEGDPDSSSSTRGLLTTSGHEVRSYTGSHDFLGSFRVRHPQCLILDVFLPLMSGLEIQRRIRALCPGLPVILMTGDPSTQAILQAFRQGAEDFLEKPLQPESLLDAVGRALEKDGALHQASEECLFAQNRIAGLTPREREVFELIVEGHSSRSAAGLLGVGKRTVDFHRASLSRKLGARSLVDLVRLALSSLQSASWPRQRAGVERRG